MIHFGDIQHSPHPLTWLAGRGSLLCRASVQLAGRHVHCAYDGDLDKACREGASIKWFGPSLHGIHCEHHHHSGKHKDYVLRRLVP